MSSAADSASAFPPIFAPNGESPVAYARRLVRERHYRSAIQICRSGLKDGPPSAELHEILGRALLLSGDAEGSLWHFLQLTLLLPEQAIGFANLGAAYNQLEKYSQAIEVLSKAVKLNPTAAAYHNLGLAHQNLKNLPSAKTAFREALRLNPSLAEAQESLASVYFELGDFTLAIAHYRKALELRPGYAKASDGLRKATLALSQPRIEPPVPERVPITAPSSSAVTVLSASVAPTIDPLGARYLGRDIARAANDLRQHFENTIIPLLTHMRRLIIEGRGGSALFREQQAGYRAACQHNSELRRTLRQLCLRLFATNELTQKSSR